MNSIFEPQTRYSAREYMIDIWLDYWNNYLTVGRYAECNGLTDKQAELAFDDGYIPDGCGDFRIEILPDLGNRSHVWAAGEYYLERE